MRLHGILSKLIDMSARNLWLWKTEGSIQTGSTTVEVTVSFNRSPKAYWALGWIKWATSALRVWSFLPFSALLGIRFILGLRIRWWQLLWVFYFYITTSPQKEKGSFLENLWKWDKRTVLEASSSISLDCIGSHAHSWTHHWKSGWYSFPLD